MDRFLHPSLSLIAGPEGVGNVLSCVYHSQAELGVAGLTVWSCGGDIRRFGREPQRGDLAFVLQTQSHARYLFIYLFIYCTGIACLQLHCGDGAHTLGEETLGACSPGCPQEGANGPGVGQSLLAEQMGDPALLFLFFCLFFQTGSMGFRFLTLEFCAATVDSVIDARVFDLGLGQSKIISSIKKFVIFFFK